MRFWQNYFDTGEYLFARYTNSLELGCDCLGEIHYFDATISDETGHPRVMRNAICLHEEDYGVAWKHTDMFTGMAETRRSRRLVISFFTTIGNYDYGFYWYLYTRRHDPAREQGHRRRVHLGLPRRGAPLRHRDRPRAWVRRSTSTCSPPAGHGRRRRRRLGQHRARGRRRPGADQRHQPLRQRLHPLPHPDHPGVRGRPGHRRHQGPHLARGQPGQDQPPGQPVGYALHPENAPVLLADDASSIHQRATFSTKSLWVTAYDPAERYPAGDFVNQHPGAGGLPAFVQGDAELEDTDVVLWHTFGLTHFPRPEDWPVMPTDYAGFVLKPVGFFDQNPALGIPASTSSHCQGKG